VVIMDFCNRFSPEGDLIFCGRGDYADIDVASIMVFSCGPRSKDEHTQLIPLQKRQILLGTFYNRF